MPIVPWWARAAALVGLSLLLTVWAWWPMFAAYPGTSIEDGHWLGVILCVLGFFASATEMTWLVVIAFGLGILMMGHFNSNAPWLLLHEHVFPFKQMRVPARFRLFDHGADQHLDRDLHRAHPGGTATLLSALGLRVAGGAGGLRALVRG